MIPLTSVPRATVGLISIAAIGLMTSGCTPLGKGNVVDNPPSAHQVGEIHQRGPARESTPQVASARAEIDERWAGLPPLSPGDRLRIDIENGDGFSGLYEIDIDGHVRLPRLSPLSVAGSDTQQAAKQLTNALIAEELFLADRIRVSVSVHEWASVQVHIAGAVFNPGTVIVNVRKPEERILKRETLTGDFPIDRMLSSALRTAGGVRPDADIANIQLVRNGESSLISYAGLLQGAAIPAVPLMSGDQIIINTSGVFDRNLVAPSAITPPGVRVFLSNLTEPATGNAIAAVGKEASSLPYGSRLLTGAISANCVGGIQSTSASRHAVLVRTNPLSGTEEVVERAIDDLFADPARDDVNPLLMPNDSVACYDSGVTNFRDILRIITEALLPFSFLL